MPTAPLNTHMSAFNVLRQQNWSEDELREKGFHYFEPIKRRVMARLITEETKIEVTLEVLTAGVGDIVIYMPSDEYHENVDEYEHWPVQRDLFRRTYKPWNEKFIPNKIDQQLIIHGCRPYYKHVGIWALKLPFGIYVQSLESPEPVLVPTGRWLCIGSEGEPYHMSDENLRARYVVPSQV
jgi:hypothetical protein